MISNIHHELLPPSKFYAVQHYQQKGNWDCGISCIIMILNEEHRKKMLIGEYFNAVIEEEGFGHSTWTIDLCYLLKRFDIQFLYTTITMGVDPNYESEAFYNHILQKDTERVSDRFAKASENGVNVQERKADLSELLSHLAYKGPIIVLTNANLLICDSCNVKRCCGPASVILRSCQKNYQGHYILVTGYDNTNQKIIYRNPTLKDRECIMSFDAFDEARNSYGTDEDIIFIHKKTIIL